jgi:peptide/nickel transport system permease protein
MSFRYLAMFICRRLVALFVLLVIISFGVFAMLTLAPGSTQQILLGGRPSTPAVIHQIQVQYHLNDPFLTQYWIWLKHALHFDFGNSILSGSSVVSTIRIRMGVTIFLGVYAFLLAMVLGVPLGVLAALHSGRPLDRGVVAFGVVGVSIPAFATGVIALYIFAVLLGWFPSYGSGTGTLDRAYHLTLPALALALTAMALVLKLTRAAMIGVLAQDHVAFARARGVSPARVLFVYALRNALIPVVTAAGLVLGYVLTGAVLVEVTFGLPGLGSLLISAVNSKDIPVVQGLTMVVATIIILVNLATDVLYMFIDPRVRLGQATQ